MYLLSLSVMVETTTALFVPIVGIFSSSVYIGQVCAISSSFYFFFTFCFSIKTVEIIVLVLEVFCYIYVSHMTCPAKVYLHKKQFHARDVCSFEYFFFW